MTDPIDAATEAAKATQEVAKTTGKIVDAGREFGGFVAQYVGRPLEQAMGIINDRLSYTRWANQLRLMQRADALRKEAGIAELRPLPFKLAIPLLEAAAIEDDAYLQDMWAKLLVNSANPAKDIEITRSYISILEQLTPFTARLLEMIYALPFDQIAHNGVWTGLLPEKAVPGTFDEKVPDEVKDRATSDEVVLALADLKRHGCMQTAMTWGGGETFARVLPTMLGKHFVAACTM